MGKMIECHNLNPTSECDHIVRGENEGEVMRNAEMHAREHGLEPTPELMAQVRSHMEDEAERD